MFLCHIVNQRQNIALLPDGVVFPLHLSSTVRALIDCIPMTIRPYPGHWNHIVIIVTNGSLKFRHIFLCSSNLKCNFLEFISLYDTGNFSSLFCQAQISLPLANYEFPPQEKDTM
jgi:hypothetical protein